MISFGSCQCGPMDMDAHRRAHTYAGFPDALGAGTAGVYAGQGLFVTGVLVGISVWAATKVLEQLFFGGR